MSNKEIAVEVNDIHKEFILPQHKNSTFKQTVVNIVKKNNKVTQKVLDGVSFNVNKGDFFGIVGRNGSGKSTLLKLIAGVYTPTEGYININGGLTPFIELGVGFNPELSGRDNVYLNGALLGYNRKQVDEMYDEIVDFAELAPFMDQKLKNYSSGMQVRLAFSIAIKAKNEILIFDEVLAVGDEAFQRKCLDTFERYRADGQTVILVTHDMATVKQFCNRAVLIDKGKVIKIGNPISVADKYSYLNQKQIDDDILLEDLSKKQNKIDVKIKSCGIKNQEKISFCVGEEVLVEVNWRNTHADIVMLDLFKQSGEHVTNFKSIRSNISFDDIRKINRLSVKFNALLIPGKYDFVVSLRDSEDNEIESVYNVGSFMITEDWSMVPSKWSGLVAIDHIWNIKLNK